MSNTAYSVGIKERVIYWITKIHMTSSIGGKLVSTKTKWKSSGYCAKSSMDMATHTTMDMNKKQLHIKHVYNHLDAR